MLSQSAREGKPKSRPTSLSSKSSPTRQPQREELRKRLWVIPQLLSNLGRVSVSISNVGMFPILNSNQYKINQKTGIISSHLKSHVPDPGEAQADGALILSLSPFVSWGSAPWFARAPIPNRGFRLLLQRPSSLSPSFPSAGATSLSSPTFWRPDSAI